MSAARPAAASKRDASPVRLGLRGGSPEDDQVRPLTNSQPYLGPRASHEATGMGAALSQHSNLATSYITHTMNARDDELLRPVRISPSELYTWPPPFPPSVHDHRDPSGVGSTYLPPMPQAWPEPDSPLAMPQQLSPPRWVEQIQRKGRGGFGLEPLGPPPDARRASLPPRLPPPPASVEDNEPGIAALTKHHELSLTKRCQGPRILVELYGSAMKDEQPTERCQQVLPSTDRSMLCGGCRRFRKLLKARLRRREAGSRSRRYSRDDIDESDGDSDDLGKEKSKRSPTSRRNK